MSKLKDGNVHLHPSVSKYTRDKFYKEANALGVGLGEYLDVLALTSNSKAIENRINVNRSRFADTKQGRLEFLSSEIERYMGEYNLKVSVPKNNVTESSEMYEVFITDLHYNGSADDVENVKSLFTSIFDSVGNKPFVLNILGDMIDGTLRVSDLRKTELNVIQQSTSLGLLLSDILSNSNVQLINYVYGNHSEMRIFGESRTKEVDNAELIIATILSSNGFLVQYDSVIEFNDYILTHGHLFKNVLAMSKSLGSANNVIYYGHYHSLDVTEHDGIVCKRVPTCQSGNSDYELSLGFKDSRKRYLLKQGNKEACIQYD